MKKFELKIHGKVQIIEAEIMLLTEGELFLISNCGVTRFGKWEYCIRMDQ